MDNDMTKQQKPLSLSHRIFLGSQGIRAGWSIGIFIFFWALLTFIFIFPTLFLLGKMNLPENNTQPIQSCATEFAGFLGLLGASMYMAFLEHKPLISFGLEGSQRFKNFFYGTLSGVAALSVLVLALDLCGFLFFEGKNIFGWKAVHYAFGWGVAFFLTGLYEEYLLRGYLQATLSRGIGFWWSALILSAAFGFMHLTNQGESPVGIISAILAGLIFCISLWYLKNLWWAIGFHASWDWAQSYLWGTADSGRVVEGHLFSVHPEGNILWSGGATGPEGSIIVIPLLLFIALLMWIVWRRTIKQQMNNAPASV
jgi:uncharacterized protein